VQRNPQTVGRARQRGASHVCTREHYRDGTDSLLDGFRRTTEALAQLDGFERAYFLTDAESGRSMMTTVWDSQAAMDASAEWAEKAREHATHDSGTVVESVTGFQVALTAEKPALR
jgi:heme-degrading monooxygenase HmoA